MAELYLIDLLKRAVNAKYGFNFNTLQYGTIAAARRAEMALAADRREYLGEALAGGHIQAEISSILSRVAPTSTGMVVSRVARATHTAARTLSKSQRAEAMDLSAFVTGILRLALAPVNFLVVFVWIFITTFLTFVLYTLAAIPLLLALYFLVQGLAYTQAFAQIDRRVWFEDLGLFYALSGIWKSWLWLLWWVLVAPFYAAEWAYWFVRESEGWKEVCDLWRRGKRAIGSEGHRTLLNLRYKSTTDWTTLQYYRLTNWVSRNALRILLAGVALWLGWQHISRTQQSAEIVHFGSMQEMAAYFGVPQDPFLPKREFGSNSHYRPDLFEGVEVRDAVVVEDDVAEERMAIDGGFSVSRPKVEDVELAVQRSEVAGKGAKMLQAEKQPTEAVLEESESEKMAVMGEDWVGYCRRCQQRHCCEALET